MSSDKSVARADDPNVSPHPASSLPFPVVGLGASAGGIQALLRFFESAPADMDMAFVVVLHLSPEHESSVDQVLQRVTRMPVAQVVGSTQIQKNHVYVISPSKNLTMNDGHLLVTESDGPRGRPVAIDLFFRSLAQVHRERAMAVILSGSGSDGAVGIGQIKEFAGITIAQSPDDAEYPAMPQSAIATHMVDFVLPVVDIPQQLIRLWGNARVIQLPNIEPDERVKIDEDNAAKAEQALLEVLNELLKRTGHDFSHYKRATVLRRIERRMQVNLAPTVPAYRDFLLKTPEEAKSLLRDMLIGVTNFFRDRESFEAFERETVPKLFDDLSTDDQIRAWVAGCSTGEEAYSIAMLLTERAEMQAPGQSIQVFATDIDERAIRIGRAGLYPASIVTDVPPTRLRLHFAKEPLQYRANKRLREQILFAEHNLLRDPPFSQLDLVSCRNLLIYLDRTVQRQVLERFHFALRPRGFLFLGSAETADVADDLFELVDKKYRIYRARQLTRSKGLSHLSVPRAIGSPNIAVALPNVQRAKALPPLPYTDLHRRAMLQYGPPSVIVDSTSRVVHVSELADRYLRYVSGEPSQDLFDIVLPQLRLVLRTAVFEATKDVVAVDAKAVPMQLDGRDVTVSTSVRPFSDDATGSNLVLIIFNEIADLRVGSDAAENLRSNMDRDPLVDSLESELRTTRTQLQASLEHADASTEELKASNEELQAINEELRSTTEELETSKEELQSINEELVTVNSELQDKIHETGKANDDLLNLISATGIATVFVDRAMRISRFTPTATALFNLIPSDLGRSLLDITHRLDYPNLEHDAADAFASLSIIEKEISGPDDKWYLSRFIPYRTSEDRIDGAVLTLVDITARRHAEAEVKTSEKRLQLAAQSTDDYAIIVQDQDGLIITWNRGATRIFGYSEAEITGKPVELIYLPTDRESHVASSERQIATDKGRSQDERWYVRKDGSKLYCSGVTTRLKGEGFEGFAKIARDLTDGNTAESSKQLQQSLERSVREQVEAADRLKDEFLAVLSHELKNPLNLIHVKAEMLTRAPLARDLAVVRDAADAIQKSVAAQATIIDDLLDMSRVKTGKLALNRAHVDIAATINAVGAALESDAAERGIKVVLSGADKPLTVWADSVRIEQVLWNLLSNALKFTSAGGQINATLSRDGRFACIEVADTGQGIDPVFIPKIFDMFSQADGGSARSKGGLGIGLALVKQLVERHGGRVSAESAGLGQGAKFSVWIPIERASEHAAPAQQPDLGILRNKRVLLVEDTQETLEAFQALLELEGAHVHAESNGAGALLAAADGHFDLILSDIGMPEMDGYELIAAIRTMPMYASTPAIALTGFGRPQDAKRALAAGFNGHVGKPVSLENLVALIARYLST
ncbi:CheR family methyltransferase [Burkholderia sp. PAMC 26561]|uniref:CheR family methyltransferase n=1 Tax=Burkholderia sp. PAMC 26561 TaxID=1795043 RepID=UPI00076AE735|nr:CheR family methyltransferase [Burkholderia sp. PAMC 26561]AME28752.1 chemotaxis protein [Burkholderia sp. PAMC 26561]